MTLTEIFRANRYTSFAKQEKMFFLMVLSTLNRERVLVPMSWIQNFERDFVKILNYGVAYSKRQTYKNFFSRNLSENPDFLLGVSNQFSRHRNTCYEAVILKCFGE